jgi:hypothetical protein
MCEAKDTNNSSHEVMLDNFRYPAHANDTPEDFREDYPYIQPNGEEPYGSSNWR